MSVLKTTLHHLFEMKKSGSGWKTLSYRTTFHNFDNPCRYFVDISSEINPYFEIRHSDFKQYSTLSKIKKDFEGACKHTCVIIREKRIYQYICDCGDEKAREKIATSFSEGSEYYTNYAWVSDLPHELFGR